MTTDATAAADAAAPASTMRAAVYEGDGVLATRERPVPEPGQGQVLVRIERCGICGTDLHLVLEQMGPPGSIFGHEWSGTVARVGPGVSGWEVGARVVSSPEPACGRCRACRSGRPAVCRDRPPRQWATGNGAYAEYRVVEAGRLTAIPEGVSFAAAALTEPLAVALHGLTLAARAVGGFEDGDRFLVTGAGPIGLLTIAALRARGVDDVTVSEPSARRRQRALEVGATRVVEPDELPAATMGSPVDAPFEVAFECSGHPEATVAALDQLAPAGVLVLLGTGAPPRLNSNRLIVLEQTVVGALEYDADGFADALELLASGRLPVEQLIEPEPVGLDGLGEAMRRLAAGELAAKVMVDPTRNNGGTL